MIRIFARMRSRRQRWIAPWLALLLLVHQVALSQHLCVGEIAAKAAVGEMQSGHCAMMQRASELPTSDDLACQLHCEDLSKIAKDPVSLQVPLLLPAQIVAITDLTESSSPQPWAHPDDAACRYRRRLHEFCVLLI